MSSFSNFLKSLNINIDLEDKKVSYVYFSKEDGSIQKIANLKFDSEFECIEVTHEEAAPIISGERSSSDFIIAYDPVLKQMALKELTYEEDLDSIVYKMYQLPVYKSSSRSSRRTLLFEQVYDGVKVYLWSPDQDYREGDVIWFNEKVYIVKEDLTKSAHLDFSKVEVYIDKVHLTSIENNKATEYTEENFQRIYDGVTVDVWYNELSHLAGQHVWKDKTVFRLKDDQPANTDFTIDNADIVETNVLLYEDENKFLSFEKAVQQGNKLLINNKLYLYTQEYKESNSATITFFLGENLPVVYDDASGEFARVVVNVFDNEQSLTLKEVSIEANVLDPLELPSGSLILLGKDLYLIRTRDVYDADVNVVQNHIKGVWEVYLGKRTKKSLEAVPHFTVDNLFFSVTAKHDPNILQRTLLFSVSDLLKNRKQVFPFKYKWEYEKHDVSVYTSKYFSTYAYEIVE